MSSDNEYRIRRCPCKRQLQGFIFAISYLPIKPCFLVDIVPILDYEATQKIEVWRMKFNFFFPVGKEVKLY